MGIVDGKKIASDIKERLRKKVLELTKKPVLSVISIGQGAVGESYVSAKLAFGDEIGVRVQKASFPAGEDKEILRASILRIIRESDGAVIQLPIPPALSKREFLNLVPQEKDPDMLSSFSQEAFEDCRSSIVPPVAGAVSEIFSAFGIKAKGSKVAVVGHGQLVGAPVSAWFRCQGILPIVLEKDDDLEALRDADIIVSGVGSPHLIKPEVVKEGAVLIDAGTSGQSGQVMGDMDPKCAEKASLFTPVPGGVGPITIAKLFENFTKLMEK